MVSTSTTCVRHWEKQTKQKIRRKIRLRKNTFWGFCADIFLKICLCKNRFWKNGANKFLENCAALDARSINCLSSFGGKREMYSHSVECPPEGVKSIMMSAAKITTFLWHTHSAYKSTTRKHQSSKGHRKYVQEKKHFLLQKGLLLF